MKDAEIQELVKAKLLKDKAIVGWRSAFGNPRMFETHPKETVTFALFVERGFAVPSSAFFRGILEFYSLQLVHLDPNSVLHIAIFVHLCEAFLGIQPHFNLFRQIFHLEPQPSRERMNVIGGASFLIREQYSDRYLQYSFVDSFSDWKERWFYIDDHEPSLPKVTGYPPRYNSRWLNQPIDSERDQVDELLARIDVLKEKGLTGAVVAASFLKRRVQPLQLRQTWGYEYSGRSDPSRMSPDDISVDEIMVRLNRMLKNVSGIPRIVEEFNHLNKPREVSTRFLWPREYSCCIIFCCRLISPYAGRCTLILLASSSPGC